MIIYGTKGFADSSNYPGSRSGAISWTDSHDNLWLFGGIGFNETEGLGRLNDLWKFDGVNWTWVSGNKTLNERSVYGTKGISSAKNYPGNRYDAISWIDSQDNLWLFGGNGYDESGVLGRLNDLWKFDGANWTWMSGNNSINANGIYGKKSVPGSVNLPGGRYNAASWLDSEDNLWLFGGNGYDESGMLGSLNDLWKFDGGNWTWVSGNKIINVNGRYGTRGVPNIANFPGGREGSVSWTDSDGDLWLFGGFGLPESGFVVYLNDL